jgi:hypothetical protein
VNKKIYSLAVTLIVFMLITSIYVFAKPEVASSSRDYLLGWYKMNGENTLIPVFKVKGTYYSICRGFETPLKVCPEGLEWAITPSSMIGTKIGFDKASSAYYIAVIDDQLSNNSDGRYGIGEKQYMTKIKKPKGLLNAQSRRPRSLDDFVGWYQPVWFPWVRIEIRKDGEKYLSVEHEQNKPGVWGAEGEPRELTPLPDKLGLTGFDKKNKYSLSYNETLKRFELVGEDSKNQPVIIRMTLARIQRSPTSEKTTVPKPIVRIGIPSWH